MLMVFIKFLLLTHNWISFGPLTELIDPLAVTSLATLIIFI